MLRSVRFVGVAAALTFLALPSAAALAAPPARITDLTVPAVTVPAVTAPAPAGFRSVEITGRLTGKADRITVTVTSSGTVDLIPPYVRGRWPSKCSRAGRTMTCTLTGPFTSSLTLATAFVRAPANSVPGAVGRLAVTARAGSGPVSTATGNVRIAEAVGLRAEQLSATIEAGGQGELKPRVHNDGDIAVDGVVLAMPLAAPLMPELPNHSNCRYDGRLICEFDQVLDPATTYTLSDGIDVSVPSDAAPAGYYRESLYWYTPAEWADQPPATGRPGTGPPVTLVPVPTIRAAQANQGYGPAGALVEVIVAGDPRADIAIIIPEIRGRVGDLVHVRIGWRHNGPGVLYGDRFDGAVTSMDFLLPTGLTLVRLDDDCLRQASPRDYPLELFCRGQPPRLSPGESVLYDVWLRFTGKATGDHGYASIMDHLEPSNRTDVTMDNNYGFVPITVLPSGATGGGGGEPTLPITGPPVGWIALVGALLTAVGVLLRRLGRAGVVHRNS